MTRIQIDAESTAGMIQQLQDALGGRLRERWGEHHLKLGGAIAQGDIWFIPFDWGVNLVEYNLTFDQETVLELDSSYYNPLFFVYCLKGYCRHRFDFQPEDSVRKLEQFQSVILTSKKGGKHLLYFPAGVLLAINFIQLTRREFLKKRLNGVEQLNNRLYEVFHDLDHENNFSFYGSFDLKLADQIGALRKVRTRGMIRIMQIEGLVYQILSKQIQDHEWQRGQRKLNTRLLKRELKIIRDLSKRIVKNPGRNYRLDELAGESGLSQAKIQEGFKLLYTRTVTEYIRHVRLEAARDYLRETDMNVSQVVYSVGFSSRSYFSKIFRSRYGISPSKFKEQVSGTIRVEA